MAKIAITGHSAGIGLALSKIFEKQGHDVIGLSRRNGNNIRSVPKIIGQIKDCDIFINNAQVGFAQTELLFNLFKVWQGVENKTIINIGTMLTSQPISTLPGIEMIEYYVQKQTLEHTIQQLRYIHYWPKLILVRPGAVATQPGQISPRPYASADEWAEKIIELFSLGPNLEIFEISLGVKYP